MRLTDRERAGERARESERGTLTEREREGARELLPLTDQHVPHMDVTECVYVRVFVCARAGGDGRFYFALKLSSSDLIAFAGEDEHARGERERERDGAMCVCACESTCTCARVRSRSVRVHF